MELKRLDFCSFSLSSAEFLSLRRLMLRALALQQGPGIDFSQMIDSPGFDDTKLDLRSQHKKQSIKL